MNLQTNTYSNLQAIIFDLGGVILNIDYNLSINAFKQLGFTDFEAVYSQLQQKSLFDDFETGKINTEAFVVAIQQHIPSVSFDAIVNAWNTMLLDLPIQRLEWIQTLRSQYKVYLYSNINSIHEVQVANILQSTLGVHNLDNYFDEVYYSHVIGYRKPNPEGYHHILHSNQLNPQHTLFIDDTPQHILGAQKVGLQTKYLERGMDICVDIF